MAPVELGERDSMTSQAAVATQQRPSTARRRGRLSPFMVTVIGALALLFGVPWAVLVYPGPRWPTPVTILGTVVFVVALGAFPPLMVLGHGRGRDWAARAGDTLLGVIWIMFAWSMLSFVLRLALALAGVANPARSRIVAAAVVIVALGLIGWGNREAMRVPRVRRVDVTLPRLGRDLDGLRVVVLTDTHYGPIDRARWSARVVDAVNALDADVVCHVGDIADGTPEQRAEQSAPLGAVRARLARIYVTGNHEYHSEAQGWLDRMEQLGWQAMHNRHLVVAGGEDRLVLAGIDDITARSSGPDGHGADVDAALAGVDPDLPVLLLAHQPKQVGEAVRAGVDLQISGHTHGGQIWPFHLLVRWDQPVVQGLSRHGERTQLYTSRGTGFWGPPFRVFAPSEISLLTLRGTARR
jgi:predicted MPP superfamily phosphohydrolase